PHPTRFYTLSLHDALPISPFPSLKEKPLQTRVAAPESPAAARSVMFLARAALNTVCSCCRYAEPAQVSPVPKLCEITSPRLLSRSEEHTSELQSPCNLVCR